MKCSKTIGSFGNHSGFIVQAFRGAGEYVSSGPDPVEKQLFVLFEHVGDFDHWRNAAAPGTSDPGPKVIARPSGAMVVPEMQKTLLEQVGSARLEPGTQHPVQHLASLPQHSCFAAQKCPAHLFEPCPALGAPSWPPHPCAGPRRPPRSDAGSHGTGRSYGRYGRAL